MSNIHCGECGAMLGSPHRAGCPKLTQVLCHDKKPSVEAAIWDDFLAALERIRPLNKRHANMLKTVRKYRALEGASE